MSAQAPDRPLHPVVKALAGLLVLCTLVALAVTAFRVKANKMRARYGIGDEPDVIEPRLAPIKLRAGQAAAVQHFRLHYERGTLEVRDAQDKALVTFSDLVRGQHCGWQELRMTLALVTKDDLLVEPEFIPGSPSFGPGTYHELRAGLRVEFPRGRALTVTAWDPVKSEGRIKLEDRERSEEHPISGTSTPMRLRWTLKEGPRLTLEDLD